MFCKNCGAQLSENSQFCGACGKPVQPSTPASATASNITNEPPKKSSLWGKIKLFGSIIFVVVLAVLFFKYYSDPYRNVLYVDDMRDCYALAQEVIKEELYAPTTAKFPDFEPGFVTQNTGQVIFEGDAYITRTVTAYVEYLNAYGVPIQSDFEVVIGFPKYGDADVYYSEIVSFE